MFLSPSVHKNNDLDTLAFRGRFYRFASTCSGGLKLGEGTSHIPD